MPRGCAARVWRTCRYLAGASSVGLGDLSACLHSVAWAAHSLQHVVGHVSGCAGADVVNFG